MEIRQISLNNFVKCGQGASSDVFKDPNNDNIILKVFFPAITEESALLEYNRAKEVESLGIDTPRALEFLKADGRYAIYYVRVKNKKSISRAISDDYEHVEEYMKRFAFECKKLHSTKSNKINSLDSKAYYQDLLNKEDFLKKEEHKKVQKLLDSIEEKDTCLHGDMHIGNMLLADENKLYWIDLGQFGYGDPIFDVSAFFFLTNIVSYSQFTIETFHLKREQMLTCWKYFVKYYYGIDSETGLKELNEKIIPYCVFFLLFSTIVLGIRKEGTMNHFTELIALIK